MKKPPVSGDNFRLIGEVAGKVVKDLEKQIEAVKRRGKNNDKFTKQPKR